MTRKQLLRTLQSNAYCIQKLRDYKRETFPPGSTVLVKDTMRYCGTGIVTHEDGCPDTHLAVRLSNGNIWYYALKNCTPYETTPNKPV